MKRSKQPVLEEPPEKKNKLDYQESNLFHKLPTEMLDHILDYSLVKDGLSMVMTSKYYHDNHKDHTLFSAGKLVKTLQQMSPYYASLFQRASTFVCDQNRAIEFKKKDKPKVKLMLKLIKKHHGKQVAKELKKKIFKKLEYLSVDHTDMKREFKLGKYLIIHSCDYLVNIKEYEFQDATVWYKCKIKSIPSVDDEEEEEYKLIKVCSWLCDSEHSNSIDYHLNRIFSISEDIDPTLIFVCLLVVGPTLAWASFTQSSPMEVSPNFPSYDSLQQTKKPNTKKPNEKAEQNFVTSLFNRFL